MSILKKKFGTQSFEAIYEVNEEQSGMRLDQFIQIWMGGLSREQIKEKIRAGEITIAGKTSKHKPNTKVYEKDQVQLFIHRTIHEDEYWNGEKLVLEEIPEIIFEDEDLYVITKPPYMATHPSGKHLFNCATVYLEEKLGRTAHSIHRLDRETSGVLLLGKSPKAAQIYTDYFEEERVKKCYFFMAIANEDYSGQKEFIAKERIEPESTKGRNRVHMLTYPEDSERGKHATTIFKVMFQEGPYCLGLAFPQTGRQHQIRVHAKAHGLPLVGDKIYLGGFPMFQRFKENMANPDDHNLMQISRHALHAMALNIPFHGERRTFISHIPKDLKDWMDQKMEIQFEDFEKRLYQEIEEYFKTLS